MIKLRSFFIIATSASLVACVSKPPAPEPSVKIEKPKVVVINAKPVQEVKMLDPEALINQAEIKQDWVAFAELIHQEWYLGSAERRQELEQRFWQALQNLPPESIAELQQSDNADTLAWLTMNEVAAQPNWNRTHLISDLISFYPDAYVLQNFYPNWQIEQMQAPLKIAVLLPFTGQYQAVAQDIQNGIIKALFTANNPKIEVKFYNSSNDEQINAIYTQAKQDGATKIIGPLRQEAIMQLALSVQDDHLLVLNRLANLPFYQFSLKKKSEDELLAPGIYEQGFRKIGILSSQSSEDLKTSENFTLLWQQYPDTKFDRELIDPKERDLRKPLANLLHETKSKERANGIRRALGEKIETEYRVRQDLDSVMIFDKAENLAVYAPQLDFYQSNIQMFSNQASSAKKRSELEAKPDLEGVRMLNTGFAIHPDNVDNIFEAFGWDSFWAQVYFDALQNDACLSISKTGKLALNNKVIESSLIWTEINDQGYPKRISLLHSAGAESNVVEPIISEPALPTLPASPQNLTPNAQQTAQ